MTDRVLGFDPGPDVTVVVHGAQDARAARAALASVLDERTPSGAPHVLLAAGDGRAGWVRRAARRSEVEVLAAPAGEPLADTANRALDAARGRHVLLLPRGASLLPGALARMVALADRAESDAVVAGGAGEDEERIDLGRAGLLGSPVAPLLRTSLIRRRGLRLTAAAGAEALFTAEALLAADAVSRTAAPGVTGTAAPTEPATAVTAVAVARGLLELVERAVPAGADRDRLVEQVLTADLARGTGPLLVKERSGDRREAALRAARDLLARFLTPAVLGSLSAALSVRYRLIERGLFVEAEAVAAHQQRKAPAPRLVERGRLYAQYPYFRDAERPVPDELYDVSHELTVTQELTKLAWSGRALQLEGIGFFEQLSTRDRNSELVLRERRTGAVERFPVEAVKDPELTNAKGRPRSMGRFRRTLDLALPPSGLVLGPGLWEVHLSVSFEGVTREVPFGAVRSAEADLLPRRSVVILPAAGEAAHELAAHHVVLPSGALAVEISERAPLRAAPGAGEVRSSALAD